MNPFAEPNELAGWRLAAAAATKPTVSPSAYPFTQEKRNFIEIFSYSISLVNRLAIGAIIVARLWRYRKAGVLRWSELKTKFHILLLCTVRAAASMLRSCMLFLRLLVHPRYCHTD
jgi:hypothetical protein